MVILIGCHSPDEVIAADQNGTIRLQEVREAAKFLQLKKLSRQDELRLARDLAVVRELYHRALAENLQQEEAIHYMLHRYLPQRLKLKQVLDGLVEQEFAQGIWVLRSRALTLKLTETEIISGSPVTEKRVQKLYNEVISGRGDFASLLTLYEQPVDFRELPVALFPENLQEAVRNCPEAGVALLPPVDVGTAWMLVECAGWRRVSAGELQKLLPETQASDRETILVAERERLRSAILQRYAVGQGLSQNWRQQSVLFLEQGAVLTRQDFLDEVRFEAWRRNIHPNMLFARHELLDELYRDSCRRLRLLARDPDSVDEAWLSFERRALLARLVLLRLMASKPQKMLDGLENGFSEAGYRSTEIREMENKILEEINFHFVRN